MNGWMGGWGGGYEFVPSFRARTIDLLYNMVNLEIRKHN